MGYFFYSGSSRGADAGTTITLTEPLSIEVTPLAPIITMGTVLRLPVLGVDVELVLPDISMSVEVDIPTLNMAVTLVAPLISIGSDANSWWYYNMMDGE